MSGSPVQQLGFGLGLRPQFHSDVLSSEGRSSSSHVSWFEVVTENFLGIGGRPSRVLEQVRRDHPIALHGVAMSLGSIDPLDERYLKELSALVKRIDPFIVSDHLCWTGQGGQRLHDLLPLPYTREALDHLVIRVSRVQDRLKRRILLENVSSYLEFSHSEMTEWEFLTEVSRRADCGLLLDVNNVYVSAVNHGFDARSFLDGVPADRVGQIHLAGHSRYASASGAIYLIDTHDHPVCPEVWELYAHAVRRFGAVNTMVEWDENIPGYAAVCAELMKAKKIAEGQLGWPTLATEAALGESPGVASPAARGAAEVDAMDHHGA